METLRVSYGGDVYTSIRLQIEAHATGDDNGQNMTLNETSTSLVQKAFKGLVNIFDRSTIYSRELNDRIRHFQLSKRLTT